MKDWFKNDSTSRGFIVGLLAPLLGFIAFKYATLPEYTLNEFLTHVLKFDLLAPVISVSLIFNAAVFFLFLKRDAEYSARGILMATFIYGAVIVYLKFF